MKWHLAGKKILGWRYIPRAPLHLDIELSYACNFKCVMCPQAYDENEKGVMETDLAIALVKQAALMGVSSIKWNWRGEATLNKDIAYLTYLAKELGIPEVQLNTNGNMRGCNVEDLINAGIDRIIFSVDADTKETFDSIRIGGDFEELTSTILRASGYKQACNLKKPFIRVQMCKQEKNAHEVEVFTNRWKDLVDDVRVSQVTDRGSDGFLHIGDLVATGRAFCKQPFQRLTIGYDGKVMGCCADWFEKLPLDDSNKTPLQVIWENNGGLKYMRDAQIKGFQGKMAPCDTCWAKDGYTWASGNKNGERFAELGEFMKGVG